MHESGIRAFGERQRQLLTLLLEKKHGVSADELAQALAVSRSAVHQHLGTLEAGGYVEKRPRAPQGGRPGFLWRLSERGVHLFPKHYAFFSGLLIAGIRERLGAERLKEAMQELGRRLAERSLHRVRGKPPREQVEEVATIMAELGYWSRTEEDPGHELPLIDARNCIYHDLAREHREVCQLDLALMGTLLDADIQHVECMVRGGNACRFRVRKATSAPESRPASKEGGVE
jgi:DeoR family transcriptional regulator, suf operon transcriptional repressor